MKFLQGKMLFALAAFFITIAFSACTKESASNVNQDRIYAEYELFYDKNTDKTTAIARFKFGGATGTLLELDSTATVTFNGDILPFNALLAAHLKEYAGFIGTGKFVYTNIDNDVFQNSVPAFEPIAFPTIGTMSKTAAYTLNWVGTPLAPDQEVGLAINGINEGDLQLFLQTADGATSLILAKNQLEKLGIGQATAAMDRSTISRSIDGTTVGGVITGKYRAKSETFQITN
ncbi:MAG: hypothetical protein H7246_16630 [Phycisphaerae bacterium]|nr:hypothetical protein [Saprospiraceae bacterium]